MPADRADPRFLLALAWIAGFTLIDSSIVSLALPDIARDFDRSSGELAWVSTGYLLALAATLLAAGRLNDRYGSRLVLGVGEPPGRLGGRARGTRVPTDRGYDRIRLRPSRPDPTRAPGGPGRV